MFLRLMRTFRLVREFVFMFLQYILKNIYIYSVYTFFGCKKACSKTESHLVKPCYLLQPNGITPGKSLQFVATKRNCTWKKNGKLSSLAPRRTQISFVLRWENAWPKKRHVQTSHCKPGKIFWQGILTRIGRCLYQNTFGNELISKDFHELSWNVSFLGEHFRTMTSSSHPPTLQFLSSAAWDAHTSRHNKD